MVASVRARLEEAANKPALDERMEKLRQKHAEVIRSGAEKHGRKVGRRVPQAGKTTLRAAKDMKIGGKRRARQ
jgi:hypothetical protein